MTDCSQLQAQLDRTQQYLQTLNDAPETFCQNLCRADDEQCIKQCLESISARKQFAEQNIADIEYGMSVCNALLGTWAFTVVGVAEINGQFAGQFTLTSGDADSQTWSGTLSLQPEPNRPETSSISGTYSSANGIRMRRRITSGNELYVGTVDLSTQPPRMWGTMSIEYSPGTSGVDPFFDWNAHK